MHLRVKQEQGRKIKSYKRRFFIFLVCLFSLVTVSNNGFASTESHDHMLALSLVSDNAATHKSVQSGAWEDPTTWGGFIPDDGARVIITLGHEVIINTNLAPTLRTLRVDGKLSFNPTQNTKITFDTLIVNTSGMLEIGTISQPVQVGKVAHLFVADYMQKGFEVSDPLSPDYDPAKLGLGIIALGTVQIFGQQKTPYVSIGELAEFTTVFKLDETPDGWKVGDKIVVTNGYDTYGNTGYDKYKNTEVRSIKNIEGNVLTLDKPLAKEHTISKAHSTDPLFDLHVLNMERNIKIETIESGRAGTLTSNGKEIFENRGHIMLMQSENVSINYVELGHLGRSAKQLPVNDTTFAADGTVISIGTNPRSRYPLHFHQAGPDSLAATVKGTTVFTSPGWGYANHGSHVNMSDNIAYGVAGASFVTERGDERGEFIGNFSASTYGGSNTKWHKRGKLGDFGHTGNGFWFHGLNIRANDNIANGCADACFNFIGMGVDGISNSIARNQSIIEFNNNSAYNSSTGLMVWGMNRGSVINHFKTYAVKSGVHTTLTRGYKFNDSIFVAAAPNISGQYVGSGFNSGYKTRGFTFRNTYVSGFGTGIVMPWGIGATVENGYFDNKTDIFIRNTMFSRRHTHKILGDITFANDETNISFSYNRGKLQKPRHLYTVRNITLDIASMGKKYATYDFTQAADYIPFKTAGPAELLGLSNTEILQKLETESTFAYWAKKLRVKNSSLKQLAPGGKLMPDNVIQPANMSNQYLEELGEASIPASTMPMPVGRNTESSTLDISSTGIVTGTTTVTDIEGCVLIGGVCYAIDTVYIPTN